MSDFSVIGKRVKNVDALDKVTGGKHYPVNYSLPGMLHAKMLRSPYAHAKIKSIDVSAALALPGVKAVLTPDEVPNKVYSPIYFMPTLALGCVQDLRVMSDHVRYAGQVVAAVAAVDEDTAERALSLIDVEYEELPAVFNVEDAIAEGAPQLHDRGPGNIAKTAMFETGDPDSALANADFVFEHVYQTQRANTCYLEPKVCVVDTDINRNVTVYSSMQHLFGLREKLAYVLDLPVSKVRAIKPPYIGGGFGGKLDLGALEPVAALLSFKTNRPVRIAHTRVEDFIYGSRNPIQVTLKTGVNKDGTIVARTAKSVLDTGAHATHGSTVIMVHGLFGFMFTYNCPNRRWEGTSVYTNNTVGGGFRGYGAPQAQFAVEQQMDEMAEKLGLDPIEFRLRNIHKEGERHPIFDSNFTTYRFEECLKKGAERIGWSSRKPAGSSEGVKKRGIGLGCVPTWTSNCTGQPDLYEHSGAIVKLNPDGSADINSAAMDIGCGQNTTFCMIVAEELGISLDQVRMANSDTSNAPFDAPMHASRGTHAAGGAILEAAKDAKKKLFAIAATMIDVAIDDMIAKDGKISSKSNPTKFVTIADVAERADSPLVQTTTEGPKPTSTPYRGTVFGTSSLNPEISPIPSSAMFVEVEVDTETGFVKVERVVFAHDLGKVLNPVGAEGQVEGGVQQGIGYALMEHVQFDPDTGACLTTDFLDYKMPTAVEMPQIESIFIESNEASGPFGAKSMSECCLIAPAGAIANAVYNAIGVRIQDLPITPEKVLKALGKL